MNSAAAVSAYVMTLYVPYSSVYRFFELCGVSLSLSVPLSIVVRLLQPDCYC